MSERRWFTKWTAPVWIFNALNFLVDCLDWWDRGESLWRKAGAVSPYLIPIVAFISSGLGRLCLYGLGLFALYLSMTVPRKLAVAKFRRKSMLQFALALALVIAVGYFAGPPVERAATFTFVPPRIKNIGLQVNGRTQDGRPEIETLVPFANVDATLTKGEDLRAAYRLVLVARLSSGLNSYWNDTQISRSQVFEIPHETVQISLAGGGGNASFIPAKQTTNIEFYLLCVPKALGREFATIQAAQSQGATVCSLSQVTSRPGAAP